jgi:thioredoxin reductase (NADPH)
LEDHSCDVLIVGGGAAGLTAAIYAARAGLKTVLLERGGTGGQTALATQIENYPGFPNISGLELMQAMEEQARKWGARIDIVGEATAMHRHGRKWAVETPAGEYEATAVVIASGASARRLDVPGETEYLGRGVSYCATCDGAFFRGAKRLACVGGGNTAVEDALYLSRFADRVTLIHRRDRLRATQVIQDRAFADRKIDFLWDTVVTEILGNDAGVTGLRVKNVKTDAEDTMEVEGVFIGIGHAPNTAFCEGVVDLDKSGFILVNMDMQTSAEGVFACGDVIFKKVRQTINAAGEGCVAGVMAERYCNEVAGRAYPGWEEERT